MAKSLISTMAEKKILIVDYDSQSLNSLVRLFEPYDFQIIKATDGISAYSNFTSEKPDLVILEAMLPKLHGFDLAKKISHDTNGKIPIIIITQLYRGPQYKNEALNYLGASDYFEKPFDEAKLVESALNLLDEGEEIADELPDTDSIINDLYQKIKTKSKVSDKEKAIEEKSEAEPPVDEVKEDQSKIKSKKK